MTTLYAKEMRITRVVGIERVVDLFRETLWILHDPRDFRSRRDARVHSSKHVHLENVASLFFPLFVFLFLFPSCPYLSSKFYSFHDQRVENCCKGTMQSRESEHRGGTDRRIPWPRENSSFYLKWRDFAQRWKISDRCISVLAVNKCVVRRRGTAGKLVTILVIFLILFLHSTLYF